MALIAVLIGVMWILLGGGGADRRSNMPQQQTSWRPATEAEQRRAERDQLAAVLDEIAARRALTAPPVYRGH